MHSDVAALSKASIWREASRIVNEEGFRAFWRGNLVTIAHRLPYSSVSFYAYERYKQVSEYMPWLNSKLVELTDVLALQLAFISSDLFLYCSCCIHFLAKILGVMQAQTCVCTFLVVGWQD